MKIEVGKRYVVRDNSITDKLIHHNCDEFPFLDPLSRRSWRQDGSFGVKKSETGFAKNPFDIVSEYIEPNEDIARATIKGLPEEWKKDRKMATELQWNPSRLSRRDQFAMAAMQGLIANPTAEMILRSSPEKGEVIFSKSAARYADALIAELDKEKTE